MKTITIIIPCFNEEKGIGKVIDAIPRARLKDLGFKTKICVVDNNSTDGTYRVAKARNVTVLRELEQGKGCAVKKAFDHLAKNIHYVVMLDGDDTYKAHEIPRLIEPLESGFCDAVIGSRLGGKMKKNSFKFINRMANWSYAFLVRVLFKANVTDVLSGYFAWRKDVVDALRPHLKSTGFSLEMEMITKMTKLGFSVYSVPITYDQREGQSKIEILQDGLKITQTLFENLYWSPKQKTTQRSTAQKSTSFEVERLA